MEDKKTGDKPEEKKLTKQEMFEKEPENFYHLTDLAMAVTTVSESGQRQVLVHTGSAMEMGGLMFLLRRHCDKMLALIQIEKAQDKKIVQDITSKKGFRNFIRGK